VLSVQRQPVDHAHRHRHILELTCDFNSSIYRCGNARRTDDVVCVVWQNGVVPQETAAVL